MEKRTSGVIVFPDIFGLDSGRTKQIVDELAIAGFVTVLPDVFGKDAWSSSDWSTFGDWVKKTPWDKINTIVSKLVAYLEGLGVKSFGIIGFCWGTYPVVRACASGKFAAGVGFHPSHPRVIDVFGEDEKAILNAIKCPQLMLPAGNDPDTLKTKGSTEEILSKKEFGKDNQFIEFPDMQHGWSNRGDVSEPKIDRDVRAAMELATAFLQKHVSKL